ncbi:MAG: cysteine desulfurase [Pseudoalteromonas tetraodonis]|jgi:cysteine desulfurase
MKLKFVTSSLCGRIQVHVNGYFDHNATTPLSPAAREAYVEASERHWHNPSGLYRDAAVARRALEDAREELAAILAIEPKRVVFNSGATEGANSVLCHYAGKKIAISAVEHPCISEASPNAVTFKDSIPNGVDLVAQMAANNEHGAVQPWRETLTFCQEHRIPFLCDASQWLGKLPPEGLGECDFLIATAHKFGGPKGCGFLIIPDEKFHAQLGGSQENNHRGGTEDYPAIAAMLAALKMSKPGDASLRDAFETTVQNFLPGTEIVEADSERLWNTSMLIMPMHKNLKWLTRLSARGISVSTGSACSAGKDNPSRVLLASGYDYQQMSRALRFSSGSDTTGQDWQNAATALKETNTELGSGKNIALGKISLTDL